MVRELDGYFKTNNTPDNIPGIVWEAHKAVIRGVLIKHGARIRKQRSPQLTSRLDDLHRAEARHKHAQTPAGEAEILLLRAKITDLMQYRAKAAIQVCRRVSYESGNKCGKLLANSLKEQVLANYIPHIMAPSGQKITLTQNIAREFKDFYASLYNLQKPASSQVQIEDYLFKSGLPKLPVEASELLDEPISQYYKIMLPYLGEHKFYNSLGSGVNIPRDTFSAHIAVIPKEEKDVTACGS